MRTDPRTLDGRTFDLLVLGAGLHGAAVARDAALRGLQVLLVDAGDFGGGHAGPGLLHGGLRRLADGHLGVDRSAAAERERLLRQAPHLARPLPLLLPLYEPAARSWAAALRRRHAGRHAGPTTLPPPQLLTADAAAAAWPGLRRSGLVGALRLWEGTTDDVRLTLANVLAAATAGAAVVNWCAAVASRAGQVLLQAPRDGCEVAVTARAVVNATGVAVDAVRQRLGIDGPPLAVLRRDCQLVLPPRAGELALAALLPDGNLQCQVPHPGGTLCFRTGADDVDATAAAALRTMPAGMLEPAPGRDAVTFARTGVHARPATPGGSGVVTEASAVGPVHTLLGGEPTTHRATAERLLAAITGLPQESPSRDRLLPGADGPRDVLDPLWQRHGSHGLALRATAAAAALQPLCPHRPFLAVEVQHALAATGAVTFADLMLRRLHHVQGPCLRPDCLRAAHAAYLAHRRLPGDDDFAAAAAALVASVRELGAGLSVAP